MTAMQRYIEARGTHAIPRARKLRTVTAPVRIRNTGHRELPLAVGVGPGGIMVRDMSAALRMVDAMRGKLARRAD